MKIEKKNFPLKRNGAELDEERSERDERSEELSQKRKARLVVNGLRRVRRRPVQPGGLALRV